MKRCIAFGLSLVASIVFISCGGGAPIPASAPETEPAPELVTFHIDNESCGTCHETIYANWLKSRHARAWKSELFRVTSENYSREECLSCHAPGLIVATGLSNQPALRNELRDQGVDCIACHQDPEADDWAMHGPYNADSPAHDTIENPAYLTPQVCASCHGHQEEFNQFHSWEEGPFGGESGLACQVCHMEQTQRLLADTEPDHPLRWVGNHAFPGGYSEELVTTAIQMRAYKQDGAILVSMTNQAGHLFPGGAFRSAVLTVELDGTTVGSVEYRFEKGNRIASGATAEERFSLPVDATGEARVTLIYYRDTVAEDGETIAPETEGVLLRETIIAL